ncbi:hypothetical protein PF010_g1984 [Phytophthora fragariae]|uniref:BZIP domain-containing protein n=1 Tax=Phytophthora fragariae TaxID=53985 RepID=A0A6A4ESX9_9STRA|nr:hypothetical protein PF010_g1984 [Phytophthora fragariae]KAE9154026.1 hypothetical protein PF006_g1928 [Phytophthora fragariae]KAE9252381.1 hypothetical protein PF004_g2016 [Phytophthora fragariae]KAE9327091.1 hypothetical protein PF001_g2113 [Phytophthora fragariae]
MSKAPKAKKAALHYQPYQALGSGDVDEASMDLNMSDLPLHLDPVLSGLSSSMSRNLWDDWNENDANFGMKFDMFADEVSTASTASSTASPNPGMHVPPGDAHSYSHMSPSPYEQQNASPNPMHVGGGGTPTHGDQHKPRANVQRSLSEDIVNMLDDTNETSFPKHMETDQRRDVAMQNMMYSPASTQSACPKHQGTATPAVSTSAPQQTTTPSGKTAGAQAGGSSAGGVTNKPNSTPGAGSSNSNGANMNDPSQQANAFGGMMMNPFMMYSMMGPQGMNMMGMPMQMPMGMNMNGMNGMNDMNGSNGANEANSGNNMNGMNAMAGMNGMQLPMQMQLQLQLQMQMQMAQMAQMNGMGGMNGMQMPMGLPGMPMGMNMSMPLNMNMQQQQQVNPQSGLAGDVEMTPAATAFPMGMSATGGAMLKPARALQPKGARTGPAFVSIARKPEEPEVSSILKSLMNEEAKKKEKKLERNRDSARESRKKQQTYVETLENGIKRLQINRDLVRSYRWGVSGPGFGPLPCPNSPQMFDWKNRLEVVTGRTEAFSNIQNPANFQSLMRLNRQRRTLAMQQHERERAVWKCFVFVGRQLAVMRTRVLQVQMLRTFPENPLAMELDSVLNLTADQKLQLQCHAQQMFNEEVVELTKLFKVFFALRNEALRLTIMSPSLERHFREACSFDQLQRLLQWTENHRTVIETDLCLDEV